jgi:hypothetical protein
MKGVLALLLRNLQADSRTPWVHAVRVFVIVMVLIQCIGPAHQGPGGQAPGLQFFSSVVWSNAVVLLMLFGVSYFSAPIAEEKEAQTLPLLRMTRLSALSILLGLSTSRLLGVTLLIALQLPFTLLAVTLGGVALEQILAAYLALAAFAMLIAHIGLFASTFCPTTRAAAMLTSTMLIVWLTLSPLCMLARELGVEWEWIAPQGAMANGLVNASQVAYAHSIYGRLEVVMRTDFDGSLVAEQVWSNTGIGLLLFGLTWWGFDRWARVTADTVRRPRLVRLLSFPRKDAAKTTLPHGPAWSGAWAMAWKDFHFLAGGPAMTLFKFLGYLTLLVTLCVLTGDLRGLRPELILYLLAWIGSLCLFVELSLVAANVFACELPDQTLSLLAMLPGGIARWGYAKLLGALIGTLPIAAITLTGFCGLLVINDPFDRIDAWVMMLVSFSLLAMAIVTYLHLVTWLSLSSRYAIGLAMGIMWAASMLYAMAWGVVMMAVGSLLPKVHGSPWAALVVMGVTAVLLMLVSMKLHLAIGQRLYRLASR